MVWVLFVASSAVVVLAAIKLAEYSDVIAVRNSQGQDVARGLANYASSEARLLVRKASADIEAALGFTNEPEMIHRDNLVLA